MPKRTSRKPIRRPIRNQNRNQNKRRTSKRRFGATLTSEEGVLIPVPSRSQTAISSAYRVCLTGVKNKLIKINDGIQYINKQVKDKNNRLVLTIGSFLVLLFVLFYTSYKDIREKTFGELVTSTCTYLLGGSILGQHAIKDAFYELVSTIKGAITCDSDFKRLKTDFNRLRDDNLIDDDMLKFFNRLEDYYENNMECNQTEKIIKENSNIKSFMNLIIQLNRTHHEEMNTLLPDEFIRDIITRLDEFIKEYGSAAKQLDRELVNPMLLNMIGQKGPPISGIFLVGAPGVGKTRFVKHLGEILRTKIYEFDPKKEKIELWVKSVKEQYSKFSVFTRMALEANKNEGKPLILFIDEIDKKINFNMLDVLLELLGDSKSRKMRDPALGVSVTLPTNLIVVCASNKSLEEIIIKSAKYAPLKSRFIEIFIPNISKEVQLKVTVDYVRTIYPNITEDDEKFIRDVIYKTSYPGMRELFNISNTYVRHLQALNSLQKYKEVETPKEFRESYLMLLEEKAQQAALEIGSKLNKGNIARPRPGAKPGARQIARPRPINDFESEEEEESGVDYKSNSDGEEGWNSPQVESS